MSTRPLRFEPAEPALAEGYAVVDGSWLGHDKMMWSGRYSSDKATRQAMSCWVTCCRCKRELCVWTDAQGIAEPYSVGRLKRHLKRHRIST